MSISPDHQFAFDVSGYLRLRGALMPEEVAEYTTWIDANEAANVESLNADDPSNIPHQLNRPVSRIIDADGVLPAF